MASVVIPPTPAIAISAASKFLVLHLAEHHPQDVCLAWKLVEQLLHLSGDPVERVDVVCLKRRAISVRSLELGCPGIVEREQPLCEQERPRRGDPSGGCPDARNGHHLHPIPSP